MAKKVKKGTNYKPAKKPAPNKKPAPAKKAKPSKKKSKSSPPKDQPAPETGPLHYKGRAVNVLRPAQPTDSGYLEGQDQLLVHFLDDGHEVLAFRVDLV